MLMGKSLQALEIIFLKSDLQHVPGGVVHVRVHADPQEHAHVQLVGLEQQALQGPVTRCCPALGDS